MDREMSIKGIKGRYMKNGREAEVRKTWVKEIEQTQRWARETEQHLTRSQGVSDRAPRAIIT